MLKRVVVTNGKTLVQEILTEVMFIYHKRGSSQQNKNLDIRSNPPIQPRSQRFSPRNWGK